MERPISFSAEDIRDEKVRVLRGIDAIEPKNVIIGQYGKSLDGTKPAYKEDETVPKDSRCATFCAMVAYIKNERWDGVPFILKAGKGLLPVCITRSKLYLYLLDLFWKLSMNKRQRFASSSAMSPPVYLKISPETSWSFVCSPTNRFISK